MEDKNKSFRGVMTQFMGYTTGHGFGRLIAATSVVWRIFWIVAICLAFGMFVVEVMNLLQLFLSRPVQTSVSVMFEKQLEFPAVTVCNLNMIKRSSMSYLPHQVLGSLHYKDVGDKKNVTNSTKTSAGLNTSGKSTASAKVATGQTGSHVATKPTTVQSKAKIIQGTTDNADPSPTPKLFNTSENSTASAKNDTGQTTTGFHVVTKPTKGQSTAKIIQGTTDNADLSSTQKLFNTSQNSTASAKSDTGQTTTGFHVITKPTKGQSTAKIIQGTTDNVDLSSTQKLFNTSQNSTASAKDFAGQTTTGSHVVTKPTTGQSTAKIIQGTTDNADHSSTQKLFNTSQNSTASAKSDTGQTTTGFHVITKPTKGQSTAKIIQGTTDNVDLSSTQKLFNTSQNSTASAKDFAGQTTTGSHVVTKPTTGQSTAKIIQGTTDNADHSSTQKLFNTSENSTASAKNDTEQTTTGFHVVTKPTTGQSTAKIIQGTTDNADLSSTQKLFNTSENSTASAKNDAGQTTTGFHVVTKPTTGQSTAKIIQETTNKADSTLLKPKKRRKREDWGKVDKNTGTSPDGKDQYGNTPTSLVDKEKDGKYDSGEHDGKKTDVRFGTGLEDEWKKDDDYYDISDEYPDAGKIDKETKLRMTIESLIGGEPPEHLSLLGHQQFDLIRNCTWKGVDCNTGNLSQFWTWSWNYRYGNCYTFNNGVDNKKNPIRILKSSKPGPSQGLVLQFNIEDDEYIGQLSEEAGVRVVLHEPGSTPFPFEEGFSITPGMATSVGLRKTLIKRLDTFDNGSCFEEGVQLSEDNLYRKYRNATRYSSQACLNSCLGESQLAVCKCAEVAYPSESRACDIFNNEERRCLQSVKFLFSKDQLPCIGECKRACREEIYEKTISSSQWPSPAFREYRIAQGLSVPNISNGLLLNIFYNQLNYEVIEETFSYGTTKLLADIGGQLGLWIGISVLTCGEIVELIVQLLALICTRLKNGKQNRVVVIGQTTG